MRYSGQTTPKTKPSSKNFWRSPINNSHDSPSNLPICAWKWCLTRAMRSEAKNIGILSTTTQTASEEKQPTSSKANNNKNSGHCSSNPSKPTSRRRKDYHCILWVCIANKLRTTTGRNTNLSIYWKNSSTPSKPAMKKSSTNRQPKSWSKDC